MELLKEAKDKQGRPTLRIDISEEEIAAIKDAIDKHPKREEKEAIRLKSLLEKTDSEWNLLTQQNIRDIQEAVNWNIQNTGSTPILESLSNTLHSFWKITNPS